MNITPERALELADTLEIEADCIAVAAHLTDTDPQEVTEKRDAAAILRHYAEILPKWQAVLDAEPVAWRNPESTSEDYAFSFWPSPSYCVSLIIKPAP